jgi:GNAT superfamily N-acetyltransferase
VKYLKKFKISEQIRFKTSKEDEYNYVTIFSGDDEIGELTYHVEIDDYYIVIDGVKSNTHNNGVGTALMYKALSIIRKKYPNINIIMLNAKPFGEPKIPLPKLVDFYKNFGFSVYKSEDDNVIMVKEYL